MHYLPVASFASAIQTPLPQASVALAGAPEVTGNFPMIDALTTRRRALGLSAQEVGRRCGIDASSLRDWERGADSPPFDAIERWAGALGLKLALLASGDEARRGISVDWVESRIAVDGIPVRLTPMEWKVLERLARSPGRLVTHQQLFKHLYGTERDCRSQATAVRVLINKLRRLLPVRIDAQWGQGYVIGGIAASPAEERSDGHADARSDARSDGRQKSVGAAPARDRPVALRAAALARRPKPARRKPLATDLPAAQQPASPSVVLSLCRAEELGVIERFLAERGATRCPDPGTIARSGHPDLVWDKAKRKWVRPGSQKLRAG